MMGDISNLASFIHLYCTGSGESENLELEMVGREWAVRVYCVTSGLDSLQGAHTPSITVSQDTARLKAKVNQASTR